MADLALPALVSAWESRTWKAAGRQEGWCLVTREGLLGGTLPPAIPSPNKKSLLLLHGTFSHAASAYRGLANSDFFNRLSSRYDRRIYAFNHFSLSRTPLENARMLVEALDSQKSYDFDVITHSRGGLVLRSLLERRELLGASANGFSIERGVLVAAPNQGTPLATVDRWEDLLNWVANLLEAFPSNPWSEAGSWIVEGLVWLANRISGNLAGIGAMDAGGETIAALQGPPGPPEGALSALVANYRAGEGLLQRAIDVGADTLFAAANDLVVPTAGGWRISDSDDGVIPGDRVGCFGEGGNLLPSQPGAVSHVNFFDRPETVEFLIRALMGRPQELPQIDPQFPLPNRRGAASRGPSPGRGPEPSGAAPRAQPGEPGSPTRRAPQLDVFDGEAPPLHLILLPEHETPEQRSARRSQGNSSDRAIEEQASTQLLATFGSARVLEPFYLRGRAGKRWHDIISMQMKLQQYVNGNAGVLLPTDPELVAFGTDLFETLFPDRVRRLYDEARARSQGRRLDIIFTSMISWVADKPWEFAYDPLRRSFLAVEDVQFVRNVLTAVPAERLLLKSAALRILVVVAQPIGQAKLSSDEEISVIRRGFEPLIAAGLAEVEVLARATPTALHGRLSTDQFDVVHFVGHGEFDDEREQGFLLFENASGESERVSEENLRSIFCQRGVRLLFLNACDTGRGGRADFNRGVAPAIVAGGMPVVVANQFKVLDVSATSFAQHFYWSLAAGLTVGDAARESRIAVKYSLTGESIDWAVPVIFARDPNARFCRFSPSTPSIPTSVVPTEGRRSAADVRHIVGVWDIQHAYPDLERWVEEWNEAQGAYEFRVVDPSVPIGGWQTIEREDGTITFLRSDVMGKKLRPAAMQLGVNTLVGISTSPMSDGDTENLFADWQAKPVILLSTWGLEVSVDREPKLITNLVAAALILQRADLECSEDEPKTSIRYYNEERDATLLTADRMIDAATARLIRGSLGDGAAVEIAAINSLGTLYSRMGRRSPRRRRGPTA